MKKNNTKSLLIFGILFVVFFLSMNIVMLHIPEESDGELSPLDMLFLFLFLGSAVCLIGLVVSFILYCVRRAKNNQIENQRVNALGKEVRVCPNCQKENAASSTFCSFCGAKLNGVVTSDGGPIAVREEMKLPPFSKYMSGMVYATKGIYFLALLFEACFIAAFVFLLLPEQQISTTIGWSILFGLVTLIILFIVFLPLISYSSMKKNLIRMHIEYYPDCILMTTYVKRKGKEVSRRETLHFGNIANGRFKDDMFTFVFQEYSRFVVFMCGCSKNDNLYSFLVNQIPQKKK